MAAAVVSPLRRHVARRFAGRGRSFFPGTRRMASTSSRCPIAEQIAPWRYGHWLPAAAAERCSRVFPICRATASPKPAVGPRLRAVAERSCRRRGARLVAADADQIRAGFSTGGTDVLGYHVYGLSASWLAVTFPAGRARRSVDRRIPTGPPILLRRDGSRRLRQCVAPNIVLRRAGHTGKPAPPRRRGA